MRDEQRDTGMATKAIQEAYLSMEQAHRLYRRARDEGYPAVDRQNPEAVFQDAVLSFYELLRPYIKGESELKAYWNGMVPPYPDQFHASERTAWQYYEDEAVGCYQIQKHTGGLDEDTEIATDGGEPPSHPADWHEALGRPRTSRLIAVHSTSGELFFQEFRFAVLGLRELDYWQAEEVTERDSGNGFMESQTAETTRREFEPPQKIQQAKRMLTEAANELGALPQYRIEEARDAEFEYEDLLQ